MVGRVEHVWCLIALENVMLRSDGLKFIVEAHIQNKIKIVDATKLCFITSIYFVWNENSATQNKVMLSTLFPFRFQVK